MSMNVVDHLARLSVPEIKEHCRQNAINAAFGMAHINSDYNLSCLHRCCNFFGFKETYYFGGKKQWDRRGSVGTHHYTDIKYLSSEEEFIRVMKEKGYYIVCVENNIPKFEHKTISIMEKGCFDGMLQPVFVFGEEQCGLSEKMLESCDEIITIPSYGSVRSLNVATAGAVVASFYRNSYDHKN